jgi:hypothetical protein
MTATTTRDHGQDLPPPEGRAIGFVDTKEEFEAVTHALNVAGYADSKIIVLQGEEGIVMLQRLQKGFNFGDGEDDVMEFSIQELQAGHYALGVEVEDRASALRVIDLTTPLGAHSFGYFGTWVNERLTR